MTLRIERYGNSRFWALYDGQDLVAVTVYKRGAQEVLRRLAAQPLAVAAAAAQAAAVEAAARQAQELAEHARALARQAQAAAAATSGSAADARRPPAQPPGVFPARQLPPDGAQQVLSRLARGFAPPEGLGLDRFCSATMLASAWPERCPVPYAAGVGRVPPWGCLRGLLPLHTPQQWAGSPAEPELAARPAALAVPLAALTRRR